MELLLAALEWDPHIRGALILIAAVLILPGSVYLLLATNLGAKIGFVLAFAGLMGWMTVMGVIWMVYGIGLKGRAPHWDIEEVVTTDRGTLDVSTVEATEDFPRGWKKLRPGDAILGDAQAAADHVLDPEAAAEGDHGGGGGGGEEEGPKFVSPFESTSDYIQVAGYHKGGDNELFTIGKHDFFFRHSPHHAVIQVQPVVKQEVAPGAAPPTPRADPTQPITTVIMVRDLGSIRFPPFVVTLASGLLFGVSCWWLHQRDKEIARRREEESAAPTTPAPEREPVGV